MSSRFHKFMKTSEKTLMVVLEILSVCFLLPKET